MFTDGQRNRLGRRNERQPDPNRLQILAACAVIRMGWSAHERRVRWQMSDYRQQAPHCPPDLRRLLNETG